MKRHYLHITLFLSILTCFNSCSLLDEQPQSALTTEQAYESINMIRNNALLSVYQHIGSNKKSEGLQGTTYGIYDLNSITTDEQYIPIRGGDWYDGGYWLSLATHSWTASDQSLYDTWNYLFKIITLTTNNIQIIENAKSSFPSDTATLNNYIAELRALRAMYYFYAMDLFGNIPIVTYNDLLNNTVEQYQRSDVYQYIISELTEAVPLLANELSQNESSAYYGRVTQNVAYFLLAKLALNAEIYADDNWSDNTYPSADTIYITCGTNQLPAMQAVVYYADLLSDQYALEADYTRNFAIDNHNSVENIFTIPVNYQLFNHQYFYAHRSRHYSHGAAIGTGGENGTCATLETLATFGYPTNPDPRFEYNFYAENVIENGDTVYHDDGITPLYYAPLQANTLDISGSEYEKTAGARLKKYQFDPSAISDATIGNNDIVLFRYADALLMKAEAHIRMGGDGTIIVNQIRDRVGAKPLQKATLEDVYQERWRELMWEGWHRNDMIRFHKFTQQTTENAYYTGSVFNFTTVFPIPQKLLEMNPTWEQNYKY